MPKGPNGERRPADFVGCAITVAKIATGETEDTGMAVLGRMRSGKAGAKARNENMGPEARSEMARKAASARWR